MTSCRSCSGRLCPVWALKFWMLWPGMFIFGMHCMYISEYLGQVYTKVNGSRWSYRRQKACLHILFTGGLLSTEKAILFYLISLSVTQNFQNSLESFSSMHFYSWNQCCEKCYESNWYTLWLCYKSNRYTLWQVCQQQ